MVGDPPTFKTNVIRIIVGVKYCFRYSQRNRRGAQFEEEVDLATLHPFVGLHHPVQRRRREKKLLKLEEVNERFPVMTYKAWRAQRERAGLSAEGGIAPQTNPTAHHTPVVNQRETEPSLENQVPDSPPEEPDHPYPFETINDPIDRSSSPDRHPPADEITTEKDVAISSSPVPEESSIAVPSSSKHRDSTFSVDADPDEEEDHSPIPDELLATSGDNCAICIELLEDEDEVRGLTCGHCYHQTCLDPWLTQRRASCPLCKADYYIPKPPQPTDPTTTTPGETAATTTTQQTVTTEHWAPLFYRPFRPVRNPSTAGPSYPPPFTRFDHRHRIPEETTTTTTDADPINPNPTSSTTHRMYGALQFPHISMRNPFRRTRRQDNGGDAAERGEAGQSVLGGVTPVAGI